MRLTSLPVLALTTLAVASGCGGRIDSSEPDATLDTNSTLLRANDCNSLLAALRADEAARVNAWIDMILEQVRYCEANPDGCYGREEYSGIDDSATGGEAPPRASAGNDGDSNSDFGGSKESGEPSYSETNTQVAGVDEADIVKTDGKHLYILHGNTFRIARAWPTEQLGEQTVTDIEGAPSEMFVANGLAVIYSTVDGSPVYAAAGVKAPYDGKGYGEPDIAPPSGGYYPGYYPNALTKITVLRIADDQSVQIAKETYFEGNYLSSRKIGDHVRTVLQNDRQDLAMELISAAAEPFHDVEVPTVAMVEMVRTIALAKLNTIPLERWLPRNFDKNGASISAAPLACNNAYTPTAGSTDGGLTQVSTLDLSDLNKDTQEIGVFGHSNVVYSNQDSLYLAAQSWNGYGQIGVTRGGGRGGSMVDGTDDVASPPPEPSPTPRGGLDLQGPPAENTTTFALNRTHLHKFTFAADGAPVYRGSGTVDGAVGNQFALDERNGVLRVATTESRAYTNGETSWSSSEGGTFSHVFALQESNGGLQVIGAVKDLAPGEQIYSTRYVGDRAYVVTFRQVDPLFVIDMSNPTAPQLLGQLKIPGFSTYMHFMDRTHLLAIGLEADEMGDFAFFNGIQLQIFDISNLQNPSLLHKTIIGTRGTTSEALTNHLGFNYFAPKDLLALPMTTCEGGGNGSYGGEMTFNGLLVYDVTTSAGFNKRGGIQHPVAAGVSCNNWWTQAGSTVKRSVIMDDFVYSVASDEIRVANVNALDAQVARVPLGN